MNGQAHTTAPARQKQHDRGVSDLVAFILMFAIIITGVGIVSLGAFDNLTEFSDREQIDSGERGMAATAAAIDDIHRQGDTRRTFSLALGGGSVFLNETYASLSISDGAPNSDQFNSRFDDVAINATEHRFDRNPEDITVLYEGGGVFRSPGYGARYEPSITCGDGVAIVSLVSLEARNFAISRGYSSDTVLNPRGLPGESPVADLDETLLFSANLADQTRTYRTFNSADPDLKVNFTASSKPEQWKNYFEQSDNDWVAGSETGVGTCENLDTVLVRISTVELSL